MCKRGVFLWLFVSVAQYVDNSMQPELNTIFAGEIGSVYLHLKKNPAVLSRRHGKWPTTSRLIMQETTRLMKMNVNNDISWEFLHLLQSDHSMINILRYLNLSTGHLDSVDELLIHFQNKRSGLKQAWMHLMASRPIQLATEHCCSNKSRFAMSNLHFSPCNSQKWKISHVQRARMPAAHCVRLLFARTVWWLWFKLQNHPCATSVHWADVTSC